MDPLNAWKDDFHREVEEVLAVRARARERGEEPPEEGFGFAGRLSDLVIPPAGTYAQLHDAQKNLELARREIVELRDRVDVRERALEREKESRERLNDGISRLALAVREERAGRDMAQEDAKKAWDEMEVAKRFLASVRLEAEHAAARAEDWEREAMARQRSARDLQARLERVLLDSDAKEAELASLETRLAALKRRAEEEESSNPKIARLEREKLEAQRAAETATDQYVRAAEASQRAAAAATEQCSRATAAERSANARLAILENELHLKTARVVDLESKTSELAADAAKAREEKAVIEREAREEVAVIERKTREELAVAERAASEAKAVAEREVRDGIQSSYREGVDAARKRVDAAEHSLADAQRIAAEAAEKERKAVEALTTLRVQIRMKMEKLLAATLDERDRKDEAIATLLRAEAAALERVVSEKAHRESILEEARAKMRAEFEDERARLESEMDGERRTMRARWQEQAEALERLRKEIEGGRKES